MTLSTVLGTSSHTLLFNSLCRNGKKRTTTTTMACSKSPKESSFCKRRAVLFVGISVLPLIQLKSQSFQSLAIDEPMINTLAEKQEEETPANNILSLLNGVGIISAGVLGALYALARKENSISETTIESMKTKLKRSEEAIVSLEKAYDLKLAKERDVLNTKLKAANEDKQALTSQLNLAMGEVAENAQELKGTKKLVDDLNREIENLQTHVMKAGESKKELEEKLSENIKLVDFLQEKIAFLGSEIMVKEENILDLESTIAEKEMELEKLDSSLEKTKDELAGRNSENASLKQEVLEKQKILGDKNALVDDLNAKVSSLVEQVDDLNNQLGCVRSDYDDLKSSSEEKSSIDAKLLEERELEIRQLKEKIVFTSNELRKNQVLVSDLTRERDDLKKSLDIEVKNAEILKQDLKGTEELLGKSRNEVLDLEKQLEKSRNMCLDLEGEISTFQTELSSAKELLISSLDEAKRDKEFLTNELATTRDVLKNTNNEKQNISQDLEAALEKCNSLQNELVDVYKKSEKATNDLKEEKKNVSSLSNEIQALEKQLIKDKESRKSLESGLEETTKSLDEMNRNALILSKELEEANSQISTLEVEKELIYKTLDDQKRATQEARENMEDAQNLLMRLGEERESLKKRGKKSEEDLAAAKGEILRLRTEMTINNNNHNNASSVEDIEPQKKTRRVVNKKKVESEDNSDAVLVKKSGRRKKSEPQTDSS